MKRQVFMISDGTGITAETLGDSLLSQFDHLEFDRNTIPYIDSIAKAETLVLRINQCFEECGVKPLVFMTLLDPEIRARLNKANACIFDFYGTYLGTLEKELHQKSSYTVGLAHGVVDIDSYLRRIEAIDFALNHDDGIKTRGYDKADIILIGVSRCGKTPSCLYLALQYGILAANYPFTDEITSEFHLPHALKPYKNKLFGLTINTQRLQQIRQERRPDSQYASTEQCRLEVSEVEAMYKRENIPFIDSTKFSIEEIATKILAYSGLHRKI